LTAQYVSSDIIVHHQEQLNCNYSFLFYSRLSLPAAVMDRNEQKDATVSDNLLFHRSLAAQHVSSDVITHHQEQLNCNYSFGFYSRLSLPAAVRSQP
jgi:hypothetical protein